MVHGICSRCFFSFDCLVNFQEGRNKEKDTRAGFLVLFLPYATFLSPFICIFLKLWAIATRVNSVFTFSSPLKWNLLNSMLCLMSPKQLSISILRCFFSR